jgi:hypothetical protein
LSGTQGAADVPAAVQTGQFLRRGPFPRSELIAIPAAAKKARSDEIRDDVDLCEDVRTLRRALR